jgi:hypothetical protein
LTGINDGDALQFAPEWIRTPNAGNLKVFREYTEKLTLDRGLALATTDALEFAYTYWNNPERDQDWWVRTGASYMSTDWRYGAGEDFILHTYFNSRSVFCTIRGAMAFNRN